MELNNELKNNNEDCKCKKDKKKLSTSKLILISTIVMCFEIIIFCQYAMIKLCDTTAMYVMIGIPAALSPTILGYYNKSRAENTKGGIVYDMAIKDNDSKDELSNLKDSITLYGNNDLLHKDSETENKENNCG